QRLPLFRAGRSIFSFARAFFRKYPTSQPSTTMPLVRNRTFLLVAGYENPFKAFATDALRLLTSHQDILVDESAPPHKDGPSVCIRLGKLFRGRKGRLLRDIGREEVHVIPTPRVEATLRQEQGLPYGAPQAGDRGGPAAEAPRGQSLSKDHPPEIPSTDRARRENDANLGGDTRRERVQVRVR